MMPVKENQIKVAVASDFLTGFSKIPRKQQGKVLDAQVKQAKGFLSDLEKQTLKNEGINLETYLKSIEKFGLPNSSWPIFSKALSRTSATTFNAFRKKASWLWRQLTKNICQFAERGRGRSSDCWIIIIST